MKLLANENFPFSSVLFLRNAGYDVISIGTDYAGISDTSVIELAEKEQRTILTFDRDYGTLIYKHAFRPSHGVIYLRMYDYLPEEPGQIIHDLLQDKQISTERTFTVFDGKTIRQSRY